MALPDALPEDLWRVEDPAFPGALVTSAGAAVVQGRPPPGTRYTHEPVAHPDAWPAEEAIAAINADRWHARGMRGQGVNVAVFDPQWFGAGLDPTLLGPDVKTWDCGVSPTCVPPMDPLRPRFGFEEGAHGLACAQVIRDLAPDAELHLVRVSGSVTLESASDWAIREGIDVVSMSLSFFNESFYDGTGRVNGAMDRLTAAGVLVVASAGNTARGHRMETWTDGNGDGRMDLDGADGLWLSLSAGTGRAAYVSWDQYGACGRTDLDAYLRDASGAVVGRSEDPQDAGADRCEPFERLTATIPEDGWYRLEIVHRRGPVAGLRVKVLVPDGTLADPLPEGSVTDPSTHPAVLSVGAVRADGYLENDIESFSSRGPTSDGRSKPDIAGPDGLTGEVYGAGGFFGTSASTPAVAAAVALVMSEDPTLTPYEAADRLKGWAISDDLGWELPDTRFGAGKARLPDRDAGPVPCGRRPLLLPLLLPFGLFRRLRRS